MMADLRAAFGCPAPAVSRDGVVTTATASPCRGGTEIALKTVDGGLHRGPLGTATGGKMASADIPALLTFLLAHTKAPAR